MDRMRQHVTERDTPGPVAPVEPVAPAQSMRMSDMKRIRTKMPM